mgnify:CR=1 FL=1
MISRSTTRRSRPGLSRLSTPMMMSPVSMMNANANMLASIPRRPSKHSRHAIGKVELHATAVTRSLAARCRSARVTSVVSSRKLRGPKRRRQGPVDMRSSRVGVLVEIVRLTSDRRVGNNRKRPHALPTRNAGAGSGAAGPPGRERVRAHQAQRHEHLSFFVLHLLL